VPCEVDVENVEESELWDEKVRKSSGLYAKCVRYKIMIFQVFKVRTSTLELQIRKDSVLVPSLV